MRLFLASSSLATIGPFLTRGAVKCVALIPTAAERLPDRKAIVARLRTELRDAGVEAVLCDPDVPSAKATAARCEAFALAGGDPFHLIVRLRATGFDRFVSDAVRQGVPYIGVSAGAIVAGPTLEPVQMTSPFRPQPGQSLVGLGLTDCLVLPHHDRRGRAAKHAEAMKAYGDRVALVPLTNREALVIDGAEARVVHADRAAEDVRRTWKGLRADADVPTMALDDVESFAKDADAKAEAREEAKWKTLFASGLVSHDSVPVLQIARDEVRWGSADDVEVHVLLRVTSGASVGAILGERKHDEAAVVAALCRLAGRGVIRFE